MNHDAACVRALSGGQWKTAAQGEPRLEGQGRVRLDARSAGCERHGVNARVKVETVREVCPVWRAGDDADGASGGDGTDDGADARL